MKMIVIISKKAFDTIFHYFSINIGNRKTNHYNGKLLASIFRSKISGFLLVPSTLLAAIRGN